MTKVDKKDLKQITFFVELFEEKPQGGPSSLIPNGNPSNLCF